MSRKSEQKFSCKECGKALTFEERRVKHTVSEKTGLGSMHVVCNTCYNKTHAFESTAKESLKHIME